MPKKRIGKGLSALIPADLEENIVNDTSAGESKDKGNGVIEAETASISAAKNQARTVFDEEKLAELTVSVKEHGVIQPLLVRAAENGYELIAGERRLRAAMKAGLKKVPVLVVDADHNQAAEMGLIENIQREDLNAMEEAVAFREMMDEYGYTQEALSKTLGKSRSYIANTLRLLTLDEDTKKAIEAGILTAGHGRALLTVKSDLRRQQLKERILRDSLSVRQAEELAKMFNEVKTSGKEKKKEKENLFYKEMEGLLRQRFQTKIKITGDETKGGKIELSYHNKEELNRLLDIMVEAEKTLS